MRNPDNIKLRNHGDRPGATKGGFTLLELIAGIGIVLILLVVVIAATGSVRESVGNAQCISNLKQLGAAVAHFQAENQSRFPAYIQSPSDSVNPNGGAQQWDFQLFPYLGYQTPISNHNTWWAANVNSHKVFYCPSALPSTHPPSNPRPERSRSYWFNRSLAQDQLARAADGGYSQGIPAVRVAEPSKTAVIMEFGHPAGENESLYLGGGITNVMYFHDSAANKARNPYFRHRGHINILFADGHVAGHGPSNPETNSGWPEGVVITN